MNIFKRLLKIGQAEIHALVEKMENPMTLIEQGIEDMKDQLAQLTEYYINARGMVIRQENKINKNLEEAEKYEEKALLILQKSKNGDLDPSKAENLAIEALNLKKSLLAENDNLETEMQTYLQKVKDLNNQMEVLKFNISKWEKELTTLRAKKNINSATIFANQQMAHIDNNSTIDLLQKMKSKLEIDDALSESYGEYAKAKVDKDIDYALKQSDTPKEELEALKKKLENL